MQKLHRLWRGDLPLRTAFWDWAVLGGLAVNVVTSVLFLLLVTADRPVAAFVAGYAVSIPYNVVVLAGVWRSADRYTGERRWADLARVATLVGMVALSIT